MAAFCAARIGRIQNWKNYTRSRIENKPTALPSLLTLTLTLDLDLTLIINPWRAVFMIHTHAEIKVKDQARVETDGRSDTTDRNAVGNN